VLRQYHVAGTHFVDFFVLYGTARIARLARLNKMSLISFQVKLENGNCCADYVSAIKEQILTQVGVIV